MNFKYNVGDILVHKDMKKFGGFEVVYCVIYDQLTIDKKRGPHYALRKINSPLDVTHIIHKKEIEKFFIIKGASKKSHKLTEIFT